VTYDGEQSEAFTPQSVTLTLEDEVDCSRGDMIVRPGNVPRSSNEFDAMVVWMGTEAMVPGKSYLFKHTTQTVTGQIESLRYRVDVNSLHRTPAPDLQLNEIGRCTITLSSPIHFDPYRRNRMTGAFIVIDRISNSDRRGRHDHGPRNRQEADAGTVGSRDRHHRAVDSGCQRGHQEDRQARLGQTPATVLFTGLSGSGKTTWPGVWNEPCSMPAEPQLCSTAKISGGA
jgi:bifunctional enzyme CysN/CysC